METEKGAQMTDDVEEMAKFAESLYSNTSLLTYRNGFKDGYMMAINNKK